MSQLNHNYFREGIDCIIPVLCQGYTFDLDLAYLTGLGLPASKIVYGIMPGHADAGEGISYNNSIPIWFKGPKVLECGRLGEEMRRE